MDNSELLEKFKMNIAINKFKKENTNDYTLKEELKWRRYAMKRKLIAGLCSGIILVSGVALASNYDKIVETFFLGKGIDSAAQNGYIANSDMNYVESDTKVTDQITGITLNNINVKTKIDDFLMDDLNISTHFTFEIDSKINEHFDLDTLHYIELKDLIVTAEDNKILYCTNQETLENYCKENNLDEKYIEFSDNYYNCGLNTVIQRHNKEKGIINFVYNLYTGDKSFPKSKKLNFKFTEIQLKRENWLENENNIVNLKGNWNIDLDVPEKMYNRQSIAYKVVNCENPDFQVTNATLTDTGFEFGMIISNVQKPEQPQILKDLWQEYENGNIDINEYNRRINEDEKIRKANEEYFFVQKKPVATYDWKNSYENKSIENVTYVENEKGEKFESTMSPSRRQDENFIDDNKYSFYETFGLTTYTATDKLKVRVLFKDKPYIVELEKAYK